MAPNGKTGARHESSVIISSSDTAFWLSEVTHPYWHLTERGVEVDFAARPAARVVYDPYSNPYFEQSMESEDLVSKGFLSDKELVAKLDETLKLRGVDLDAYDAVHVAGGRGATFDLYPNEDVAAVLEHFWSKDKVVGAICHGRDCARQYSSAHPRPADDRIHAGRRP